MKKIYFFVLFFPLLVACGQKTNTNSITNPYAEIKGVKINLLLARSRAERIQGLSNKEYLSPNTGMLFIFPKEKTQNFWMKDMNFPLDILWLADDKVVGISANLQPEGKAPKNIYSSSIPVKYVLEVNAGFVVKHNIKNGDKVKLINIK